MVVVRIHRTDMGRDVRVAMVRQNYGRTRPVVRAVVVLTTRGLHSLRADIICTHVGPYNERMGLCECYIWTVLVSERNCR